jgi:DNA-binding transcriptional regulator YiaG
LYTRPDGLFQTVGASFDAVAAFGYNVRVSKPKVKDGYAWDGARVQALRQHLGLTQQEFSDRLGTRQQTISEWETGQYRPRGTSARLLSLVAEQASFTYDASPPRNGP